MNIFLAGGAHAVGKRVAYLLAKDKHEVTAAVESRAEAKILAGLGAKPLIIRLLNVADTQAALYGQEAVINLATAAWNPFLWRKNDVLRRALSLSLAHGALKNKTRRFIQESAVFLYDDQSEPGITEEGRWRPGMLTSSALTVERNALELEKAGAIPVVLRFAVVYSADSPDTRALLRFARFGFYLQAGPMEGLVSMIHADDAASAVVAALAAPAGVYNVAEDRPCTRGELAQALASALDRSRLRIPSEGIRALAGPEVRATGANLNILNYKFKAAVGWKPRHLSPREGWKAVVTHV